MKTKESINGKWTGSIQYGEAYPDYRGKELLFDLDISQEDNSIKGIAKDVGGIGMSPEAANISGTFNGKTIEFVKQYRTYHYYEKGETKFDNTCVGKPIYYIGNYNENTGTFSGNWEYRIKYKVYWFIKRIYRAGGTWTMKRMCDV